MIRSFGKKITCGISKGVLHTKIISMTFIISLRVLFFLLATPLDSNEYDGVTSQIIHFF